VLRFQVELPGVPSTETSGAFGGAFEAGAEHASAPCSPPPRASPVSAGDNDHMIPKTRSPSRGRLQALVEAGIALSSELSLDGVLQRIVEAAAELTGARYSALGVIDRSGTGLERFVFHGIDEETRALIGDLPRGRGILGALVQDAKPLRLARLSEDPRSVGFPPGHPPMETFLGVPILLRGVVYGNLYLSEKADGATFTDEDEEIVRLLAAQAAVAIENARLYESATHWLRQLESLNEVASALVRETNLERLLQLICERLRDLLDARSVAVALPSGSDELIFRAAAGEGAEELVGLRSPRLRSKIGRVLDRRRSERVDSAIDDPEVNAEIARRLLIHAGIWVPLVVRERAIGVIMAVDRLGPDPRFGEEDLRLAEEFGARAAVAVELSERVARDALRRVVGAQELERRRLARELHDETGQSLTSVLLGLRAVEESATPEETRTALERARKTVVQTLQDVRRLAVELRPKALDDFGLVPALRRLSEGFSEQTGIHVEVESNLGDERLPSEVETALYRIVQEALTNVVKHARATNVSVLVTRKDGRVGAVIEDDGRGFDRENVRDAGLGLIGMEERVALLDGSLQIESSEGAGATIVVDVPLT
jgi:signal transduction histidine kinase